LTKGQIAEQLVHDRLRAALPPDYRLFSNVAWLEKTADHRGLSDGEADLVLAHPDRGFLVFEVKAGEIARDAHGRWWAGQRELKPTPFDQANRSLNALLRKLADLPDAPPQFRPIAGHAVALPDVDIASAGRRLRLMGPDIEPDLLFDHAKLRPDDPARTRAAVERAFDLWTGDSADRRAPGKEGVHLLEEILETPVTLRSLLRSEIGEGEREVVALTDHQIGVLKRLQRNRRMAVVGAAGTGKTMLAAEKARRLASEGFETLLVCFNQPLVRLLAEETAEAVARTKRLTVSTFHQLCEDLGREAKTLPKKPSPVPSEWFSETLPRALDEAIEELGPRFNAIVIDEGQDFDAEWLASLEELLFEPEDDVLYVFHDPAQAIYRDDVVESLKLTPFDLDENCRNPGPIHDFAMGHAPDAPAADALREDGRAVEVIEAEPGAATLDALRLVLHRLRVDEGVRPWEVAVLVGGRLEESGVWKERTFGNEVLWNGQVDDAGKTIGLAAGAVPPQPDDAILCDSIRRFKGLEKPVIVLVELKVDDTRLERLLYIGASRARQHLVVIAPAGTIT
jgi:Nuclease-related domain/AAA domain/UvrD-like helicase C-terminal domain